MKTQNQDFVIGNISFTNEGVTVVRPYTPSSEVDIDSLRPSKEDLAKAFEVAINAIKKRVQHCESELSKNIATACIITPDQVFWPDGHFSLPVYKAMKEWLESRPTDWSDMTVPIAQQVARAIYKFGYRIEGGDRARDLCFNIATEIMLMRDPE